MALQKVIIILGFCLGAVFTMVDITSDGKLAYEFINNGSRLSNNSMWTQIQIQQFFFGALTLIWIGLGGICQAVYIIYLLVVKDSRLHDFPSWIRCILLLSSMVLLGPVVVYVFGAITVLRSANNDQGHNFVLRCKTIQGYPRQLYYSVKLLLSN